MNDATPSSSERLWRDLFEEKGSTESLSVLLREASLRRRARARKRQLYLVAAAGLLGIFALSWWAMPRGERQPFAGQSKDDLRQGSETVAKRPPLPPKGHFPPAPPQDPEESPAVAHVPDKRNTNVKPAVAFDIPGVKTLSDEELLDRMRGMPIALVGPKGHRRVIFLNEVSARVSTQDPAQEEGPGSWE